MSELGAANRAANTADINNLMQFGSMQQQTQAAQDQAAYQEFLRQQGLPYQALQAYNQTLSTSPHDKTTSTSGTEMAPIQQQKSDPLMAALGLGATALGAYFGGPAGASAGSSLAGSLFGGNKSMVTGGLGGRAVPTFGAGLLGNG
jgi:hypothetical protein